MNPLAILREEGIWIRPLPDFREIRHRQAIHLQEKRFREKN